MSIKCVRKNISVNKNIWDAFSKYCDKHHYKYSNKIELLMRECLERDGTYINREFTKADRERMAYEMSGFDQY